MRQPTKKRLALLSRKARVWFSTTEGQAEVKKAVKEAKQVTTELSKARRVDQECLQKPMILKP